MKFIHYGSAGFCHYKFRGVVNGLPQETKPGIQYHNGAKRGGLWGSPLGEDSELTWRDWWEQHNKRTLRQVSFVFWLHPETKILTIRTAEDLTEEWIRVDAEEFRTLDFEKIAGRFDALMVYTSAIRQLQNSTFKDWECDTILVFNKKVIGWDPDDC